jgi:hypothetical protein
MNRSLSIITTKSAILKALIESKINSLIIGIHAAPLGTATYLTAVKEIMLMENEEPLIVLVECDITGYMLGQSTLRLSEIASVIPFTSPFEHPALKNPDLKETLQQN